MSNVHVHCLHVIENANMPNPKLYLFIIITLVVNKLCIYMLLLTIYKYEIKLKFLSCN